MTVTKQSTENKGKVGMQIYIPAFSMSSEGRPGAVRKSPFWMEISLTDGNVLLQR